MRPRAQPISSHAIVVIVAIAAAASIAACAAAPPALVGCAKDRDCKGERICERGACIEPPQRLVLDGPLAAEDAPPAQPPAGPPPYAMARGGARHLGRLAGPAPVHAPAQVWSVRAGDAIVGGPTVGPDG